MFKKIIFLLASVFIFVPVKAQDDVRNVDVTVNSPEPTVLSYDFCRLSITATEFGESMITMNIDVENTNETYSIFLFGHAYAERTLKKQRIRFDKKSYGSTSKDIIVCEGLDGDGILRIEPNGNRVLTFPDITEHKKKVELPVYIARYEKKKLFSGEKYMIRQRVKLILNITFDVPEKVDNTYDVIKSKCEELLQKIESTPICTGKRHPVTEQMQIKSFQDEIDNLKDEIADIKSENHWRERDEAYKPYKELLSQLDNVEFKKAVCDKCNRRSGTSTVSKHECRFCSKSPSDILLLLQRTYQELDNRKINKAEALKKIDSAHKAWTNGCSTLKQKMSADKDTRYKVEKYYEAIINY